MALGGEVEASCPGEVAVLDRPLKTWMGASRLESATRILNRERGWQDGKNQCCLGTAGRQSVRGRGIRSLWARRKNTWTLSGAGSGAISFLPLPLASAARAKLAAASCQLPVQAQPLSCWFPHSDAPALLVRLRRRRPPRPRTLFSMAASGFVHHLLNLRPSFQAHCTRLVSAGQTVA